MITKYKSLKQTKREQSKSAKSTGQRGLRSKSTSQTKSTVTPQVAPGFSQLPSTTTCDSLKVQEKSICEKSTDGKSIEASKKEDSNEKPLTKLEMEDLNDEVCQPICWPDPFHLRFHFCSSWLIWIPVSTRWKILMEASFVHWPTCKVVERKRQICRRSTRQMPTRQW